MKLKLKQQQKLRISRPLLTIALALSLGLVGSGLTNQDSDAFFSVESLLGISPALAQGKTELRLYKMSKYGQNQRISFTSKNSKLEGCHNLRFKSALVHRSVHFGFNSCTLYSEKDCAPESVVSARLGDDKPAETKLTQGHSWYLGVQEKEDTFPKYTKEERGKSVRSWACEGYTKPPIELR